MITLDSITKLEAVLSGAASPAPTFHVTYIDYNVNAERTLPSTYRTAANGATDVTILASPVQNPVREVLSMVVYNADNANVTVTIKTDDGTTERTIIQQELLTTESLYYTRESGWWII